ncbi:hypothetical protein RUND412_007193 [Rhizina undulata]
MHSAAGPSHRRRSPGTPPMLTPSSHPLQQQQNAPYALVQCTHTNPNLHSSAGSSSSSRPGLGAGRRTSSGEVTLPEWQPDEIVKQCPLCTGAFTFWNRRHHCRTCGRVVCATCSPHRIRIPKAFVVRPPEATFSATDPTGLFGEIVHDIPRSSSWTADGSDLSRQLSSSGEEDDGMQVRVCEECLVRQNFSGGAGTLQRIVTGPPISGYSSGGTWPFGPFPFDNRTGAAGQSGRNEFGGRRRRQSAQPSRSAPHISGSAGPGRYISPHQNIYYPPSSSQHRRRYQEAPPLDPPPLFPPQQAPQQAPPRPRLAETDYCPICTRPLPPADPTTGSEEERENHVQACIRAAESGSPRRDEGGIGGEREGRRYTGGRMVVWKAAEQDTWVFDGGSGTVNGSSSAGIEGKPEEGEGEGEGEKGMGGKGREKAECVICFEEFEEGQLIARLECLCRYHKKCIREWFDVKGSGECPIHAVHE